MEVAGSLNHVMCLIDHSTEAQKNKEAVVLTHTCRAASGLRERKRSPVIRWSWLTALLPGQAHQGFQIASRLALLRVHRRPRPKRSREAFSENSCCGTSMTRFDTGEEAHPPQPQASKATDHSLESPGGSTLDTRRSHGILWCRSFRCQLLIWRHRKRLPQQRSRPLVSPRASFTVFACNFPVMQLERRFACTPTDTVVCASNKSWHR